MLPGLGTADISRSYRQALSLAAVVGLAGLLVLGPAGHLDAGLLLCAGLALGALNSRLVQASVASFAAAGVADRWGFARTVLRRLLLVTTVAVALAVVFRPAGWAVLVGLAVFQLLVTARAAAALLREVRGS